jgi:hypothetical protein
MAVGLIQDQWPLGVPGAASSKKKLEMRFFIKVAIPWALGLRLGPACRCALAAARWLNRGRCTSEVPPSLGLVALSLRLPSMLPLKGAQSWRGHKGSPRCRSCAQAHATVLAGVAMPPVSQPVPSYSGGAGGPCTSRWSTIFGFAFFFFFFFVPVPRPACVLPACVEGVCVRGGSCGRIGDREA